MHHQGFDLNRGVIDPSKAKAKMRPKDRPLVNDFVSDEEIQAVVALLRSKGIDCVVDEIHGGGESRTYRARVRPEDRSRADALLSAAQSLGHEM